MGGRSEPKPKPLCASHCKPCHLHHRNRHRHHHYHHGHIASHTILIITTVIIVLVVVIFVGKDDFGGKSCCMGRLAVPWQPIFPHAGPSGSNTSPNQAGGSAGGCCTVYCTKTKTRCCTVGWTKTRTRCCTVCCARCQPRIHHARTLLSLEQNVL